MQLVQRLPEGCGDGEAAKPLLFRLLDAVAEGQGGGPDMGRLLGVLVYEHGFLEELLEACRLVPAPAPMAPYHVSPQLQPPLLLLIAPPATPDVVAAPCWMPLSLISAEEEPIGATGSCGGSPSYGVELLQELAEGSWAW